MWAARPWSEERPVPKEWSRRLVSTAWPPESAAGVGVRWRGVVRRRRSVIGRRRGVGGCGGAGGRLGQRRIADVVGSEVLGGVPPAVRGLGESDADGVDVRVRHVLVVTGGVEPLVEDYRAGVATRGVPGHVLRALGPARRVDRREVGAVAHVVGGGLLLGPVLCDGVELLVPGHRLKTHLAAQLV